MSLSYKTLKNSLYDLFVSICVTMSLFRYRLLLKTENTVAK